MKKTNYFKLFALAIICCISSSMWGQTTVTSFAQLQAAFAANATVINVTAAITVNADFNMTSATPVTVNIATTGAPITVTGGTLTIGNNVTISETKASGITVNTGGNLVVNTGSIITNTINPTILATGGNVTVNGGTITCAGTGTVTNMKITNGSICRITGGTITCSSSTGVNLLLVDDSGGTGGGKIYITGGTISTTKSGTANTGAAISLTASLVGQLWISGSPILSYPGASTGASISATQGASRINIATQTANFTGNIKTSNNAVINNFANASAISVDIPSGTYPTAQTVNLSGGTDNIKQYTAATFNDTYANLILLTNGTAPAGGVALKYTTDGTDPIPTSSVYSGALNISTSTILKVAPYILPSSSTVGVVSTFIYNIPPVWTASYPSFVSPTTSGFTAQVSINEPGNSYYLVLASGAAAPSPAQVKAGQKITCSAANTVYTSNIAGLTSNTTYDVYFVAEDVNGTLQASVTKVTTTTVAASSVADPQTMSSAAISQSQINIAFTPNAISNNVMIAWNTTNTFGIPTDGTVYSAGNTISGGGTVVYNGGASPFTHTALTPNTTYYYKVWSVNGSNVYSSGLFTNNTTLAAVPTTQASAITFSAVTLTGMTLSWTNGNGTNRLVLVKAGSAVDSNPVVGTGYTANSFFGTSGTQIGTGNYVVYNSTGNSVAVTGLTAGTVYNVAVYEYNGTTGTYNYLTSTLASASQSSMMPAPAAPTALTFSSVTPNSFKASFTAPSTAPTGYLVLSRTGAAVTGTLVPGTTYTQGQTNIGSGINTVVYVGTTPWTGTDQTGLGDNSYYSYAVYSYNGSGATINYSTALNGNQITPAIPAPISNVATNVSTTGFTANWASVPGATSYSLDVNTTSFFPFTENFQKCLLGTPTTSDGTDIEGTINNFMQSSGWTAKNVFQAGGSLRIGYTGANAFLTTPTINLSANNGNATLTFDLKNYDYPTVVGFHVYHAPDGITFTDISGTDSISPQNLTNKSYSISGGTSASKIKIAVTTFTRRILVDNIKVYQVSNVSGYDNMTVNGTTQDITGLTPGINYYYQVRAVDANGSSVNSVGISENILSQAVTFGSLSSATYGDAPITVSATGGTSGNPVTFTSSDPTVATCTGTNGTKVTILKPGSCNILADQTGNINYTAAPEISQGLTINPKSLTTASTAISKVYDGNNSAVLTGILTGIIASDVVTLTGTFADVNVANGIAITPAATLGGAQASNYTLTQPTGLIGNITAAPLTITGISGVSKPYDGTNAATLSGTPQYAGLVNGETFAVTGSPVATFNDVNAAPGVGITVTGFTAPTANYTVTQPTGLTANITSIATDIHELNNSSFAFTVNRNGLQSKVEGSIDVISLSGVVLSHQKVSIGSQVNLTIGAYLIRVTTLKNNSIQKVIF